MLKHFGLKYTFLSIILDVLCTLCALFLAMFVRIRLPDLPAITSMSEIAYPFWVYVTVPLLWAAVFILGSVYDPQRTYRFSNELKVVTMASLVAMLLCATLLFVAFRDFSRWLFLTFISLSFLFHVGWRFVARVFWRILRNPKSGRRVLIAGTGELGLNVGKIIQSHGWKNLLLIGYLQTEECEAASEDIPILGGFSQVHEVVESNRIDDLIIALSSESYFSVNERVRKVRNLPVNIRVTLDDYNLMLSRATIEDFGGIPMVNLEEPALTAWQRASKRSFDLLISTTALIALSPLFLIVAVAIKWDTRGSVLFTQLRVGENGRIFPMFKFRSMVENAEQHVNDLKSIDSEGNIIFKKKDDPRVTRVGRFIRRTSLDELPQLFNVLQGTMSLIGPRPEIPMMVGDYESWQFRRFSVPQGMTGWWQINGRADKPMHLNTDDDLYYIKNYSLWLDLYILIKTPWIVIRGTGAY